MKVFFDAFELIPGSGKSIGIYNYAKNLLTALAQRNDEDIDWVIGCNNACASDFDLRHPRLQLRVYHPGAPGKFDRQLWWRVNAALAVRECGADIYFSPKGFLPYGLSILAKRAKSVVVIHDLIPFWYADHHPGYFGRLEEFIVNRGLARSARKADRVIAISHATAEDIAQRLGRKAGVQVVHNGIPYHAPGAIDHPKPYIFALTSKLPHKNATNLLAGYHRYRELSDSPLPLVLCGYDAGDCPGVTSVRGISDEKLHGYYAEAELFLFLALIEGFGFPPVEAMSHGTPVLCSDIPSLREITAGCATYVTPTNIHDIGMKLLELTRATPPSKEELKKVAARYDWQSCASGVVQTLMTLPTKT